MRVLKGMRVLGLAGLLFCLPNEAEAQFTQYTPPGGGDLEKEDVREELNRALEEARWNLGPVRLDPWFGITDAGVEEDAGEDGDSRATATVGAGLRAYLPTGRKVMWVAHALPEYAWRDGDSDRSRLNGRYGVGMFAFWNRLGLDVTARRDDDQGLFSAETLERTNFRTDRFNVRSELSLGRASAVFAEGLLAETRFLDDPADLVPNVPGAELPFAFLDRDETILRAGLRQKLPNGLRVGLGAERSEVDFLNVGAGGDPDALGSLDRSNSGTAPILELAFAGNRADAAADLAYRSLDGAPGFVPYDGVTGRAEVAFDVGWRMRVTVYGLRNLVYALERGYSYFEETRTGAALGLRLHRRLSASLYYDDGEADFAALAPVVPTRLDQLTRSGGELTLALPGTFRFVVSLTDVETDSNLPGEDQSFTFLSFGLRISSAKSPWW